MIKSIITAMAIVFCMVTVAMAIPTTGETGAEFLTITDTSNNNDDVDAFTLSVDAAETVKPWTIGIYGFTRLNDIYTIQEMDVISSTTGTTPDFQSASIDITEVGNDYYASVGTESININEGFFGVYFRFNDGTTDEMTWYTHEELNNNDEDKFGIYDVTDLTGYGMADTLVTNDYIVINFSDALPDPGSGTQSNPVPEPATCLLLGAGLIGMSTIGRKKLKK